MPNDLTLRMSIPGSVFLLTVLLHAFNTRSGRDWLQRCLESAHLDQGGPWISLVVGAVVGSLALGFVLSSCVLCVLKLIFHHSTALPTRLAKTYGYDGTWTPNRNGFGITLLIGAMDHLHYSVNEAELRDFLVRMMSLVLTSFTSAFAIWSGTLLASSFYAPRSMFPEAIAYYEPGRLLLVLWIVILVLVMHGVVSFAEFREALLSWHSSRAKKVSAIQFAKLLAKAQRDTPRGIGPYLLGGLLMACCVTVCALGFESIERGIVCWIIDLGVLTVALGVGLHHWMSPRPDTV